MEDDSERISKTRRRAKAITARIKPIIVQSFSPNLSDVFDESDKGGLFAGLQISKGERLVSLNFRELLDSMIATAAQAQNFATGLRRAVFQTWGSPRFVKEGLPINVEQATDPRSGLPAVKITLPHKCDILAVSPEAVLALAAAIDEQLPALRQMPH